MTKSLWFKRAIAWFEVLLFLFDTGSDSYVCIDLIFFRCHTFYGSSVLAFFWLPGLLTGGYLLYRFLYDIPGIELTSWQIIGVGLLGSILGPVVFVPVALYLLVKTAINIEDDSNAESATA